MKTKNEPNKYCPLTNFQTICGNGCAWYNEKLKQCSILSISKELSRIEWDLDGIQRKL